MSNLTKVDVAGVMADVSKVLKGLDKYQDKVAALTKIGLEPLGVGSCAVVLELGDLHAPEPTVLRVSTEAEYDGGVYYLDWCMYTEHPFIPDVFSRYSYEGVVAHEVKKYTKVRELSKEAREAADAFIKAVGDPEGAQHSRGTWLPVEVGKRLGRRLKEEFPWIKLIDTHTGNVMWREDVGIPVLTDPFTRQWRKPPC